MKSTLYIFTFLSLFIFVSCHKDKIDPTNETTNEEEVTPVVYFNLQMPLEGDTIHHQDSLLIAGDIAGSSSLHGYGIFLINTTNGDTLQQEIVHDHGSTYPINFTWINNQMNTINVHLILSAVISHEGELTSKSIHYVAKGQ